MFYSKDIVIIYVKVITNRIVMTGIPNASIKLYKNNI
jgi:hypothetical protein